MDAANNKSQTILKQPKGSAMLIVHYSSKKELKASIGNALKYSETSMFGPEYSDNGTFTASNRPQITGIKGREFFAQITMLDGKISKVS